MKNKYLLLLIAVLLLVTNIATYNYALNLSPQPADTGPDPVGTPDPSDYEEALDLFLEVWNKILEDYVIEIAPGELAEGAIKGMLEVLEDPQTYYLSENDMDDMMIQTYGTFSGIGIEISEIEGKVVVMKVFSGTPAQQAGIKPGDAIVSVDGEALQGDDIVSLAGSKIRGESGTGVTLEILRPGQDQSFALEVTRGEVELSTVNSRLMGNGIGYIQISSFDGGTGAELEHQLRDLETQGLEGLVLDLRGNPGGLLTEAINVGRILVPEGEITRVVDQEGNVLERYLSEAEPLGYPLVLLVDEGSASASEIVAGALQDRGAAALVGQTTYGKATVQEISWLDGGGGLRYTVAKYQTPSGKDIHNVGIVPDYPVQQEESFYLIRHRLIPGIGKNYNDYPVTILQNDLKEFGYDLAVTGEFDAATESALRQFQADAGIAVTGWVDHDTAEAINSRMSKNTDSLDRQLQKAIEIINQN